MVNRFLLLLFDCLFLILRMINTEEKKNPADLLGQERVQHKLEKEGKSAEK